MYIYIYIERERYRYTSVSTYQAWSRSTVLAAAQEVRTRL